tara:strand:+ start:205 stop:747 length:543 start_codon:yes stop_codon:yes gene_type:complete
MNRKLKLEELQRDSIEAFKKKKKNKIFVVLDNVRSLSNIGSIFRTSDAFLVEEILLCGISATPPNREITKTALGSTDSVEWKYFENTMDAIVYLKNKSCTCYALEQAENSIQLQDVIVGKIENVALVLGHEVKGVDQEVINACDGCVEIPQFGTKHSLNVSASASIAIWELWSKKQKAQQ